jgi:hypothetical protein
MMTLFATWLASSSCMPCAHPPFRQLRCCSVLLSLRVLSLFVTAVRGVFPLDHDGQCSEFVEVSMGMGSRMHRCVVNACVGWL